MAICLNRSYDKHRHTEASRGSSRLSLILCRLDMLLDFDSPKHTQSSVSCHDFSPCPEKRLWGIHVPFWMHTCSYPRLAIQPPLRRQAPITILSRLCWFSGSNPCSRCLLSTHLLWQPSDKQRLLKEVFHKQILPAGQWLKRPFLSPSSGTQPIELAPGAPHWGGPWARASPLGPWATLTLFQDTCAHLPPAWEPSAVNLVT